MKHKLIMENWRRFLNERKTDEEYIQAARFLSNVFSDENSVDIISHNPSDENSWMNWAEEYGGAFSTEGDQYGAVPENKNHKAFKINIKDDAYEGLWKQYQQITEKSAIFSSFDEFKYWLSKLEIYVLYEHKSASGDMSETGVMRLFLSEIIDSISSIHELLGIVKEKAYNTFIHEGTHFFNSIRAKGVGMRDSRGGAKVYDKGEDGGSSQEYKDSTEELQARMIQIQNKFMNMDWREGGDKQSFYQYLYDAPGGNDGIRQFIKEFIRIYYPYATEISEWHRKKVISRVYQFAQRILSSKDYKEYVEYRREPQETETVALQERKRNLETNGFKKF